jgi:DNA-binding NarL/FixJ family response regulator
MPALGPSAIALGPADKLRKTTRILLVDDHVVFRAGLRALLEKQRDLVVVGEAGTGGEAVVRAQATRPDVVLMDLAMPGEGGLEATRRIVALGIGAKVLVLTAVPQERQLLDALEAGASGFIEKAGPVEDLTRAIRTVGAGRLFLGADAATLVVLQRYWKEGQTEDERAAADRLSGRERQVLALLALGHSSKEIGHRLAVSTKMVDDYRAELMDRLGLKRHPELVRFALRTGLLVDEVNIGSASRPTRPDSVGPGRGGNPPGHWAGENGQGATPN